MRTHQIQKAYVLTQEWQRLERADDRRVGTLIQNQPGNGTVNILLSCDGAPTTDFAAILIAPGANLYEDIVPPNGDIWAKCDSVSGATLTLVLKYPG